MGGVLRGRLPRHRDRRHLGGLYMGAGVRCGSLFSGIGGMCYTPPMPSGAKLKVYPAEIVAAVSEAYEGGATQREIANELGMTQKMIWRLMLRHNIPRRVAAKRDQRGPKNHMWRGNDASYRAIHQRLYKTRGQPQHCDRCGASGSGRAYDWANLTGRYDDPSDYQRMCRSCHWKYDQKHLNLGDYAKRREVLPNV